MMQHDPPTGWRAHEHVGRDRGAARIAVGQIDMLDRTLHGEADGFHQHNLVETKCKLAIAGEQLLERTPHGVVADMARTARMDRHDFFVVGPRHHHRIDVLGLERLIERERSVLRRRVDRRSAGL